MKTTFIVIALVLCCVAPAFGQSNTGYHEVWEPKGSSWELSVQKYAELYCAGSDQEQYRWESNAAATICQPPYLVPEPEDPLRKVITDEAVLYPWIEVHVTEKDVHWDIFKPRTFMGKTFQMWLQANTPIQILFGSGTIKVPGGFDAVANEITWKDYTEKTALTDKIRIKSILGKTPNPGTPPDEIAEYLWWYESKLPNPPDPHRISAAELAMLPRFPDPAWKHATDLNGVSWKYPDTVDLHNGWWTQFFEVLDVETCDSEGKYVKEIILTVAPDA
jgi:hypothetical protein